MPSSRKSDKSRRSQESAARSAREIDQLDLIDHMRATEARLCDALATVFTVTDARALAAFGEVLGFVARTQGRRRR